MTAAEDLRLQFRALFPEVWPTFAAVFNAGMFLGAILISIVRFNLNSQISSAFMLARVRPAKKRVNRAASIDHVLHRFSHPFTRSPVMAIRSRDAWMLLAPCVTVGLVVTNLLLSNEPAVDTRPVGITAVSVDFVRPLEQSEVDVLASVDRLSSSLASLEELPHRPWLMDDSVPAEMKWYTSQLPFDTFEQAEADGWTVYAAAWTAAAATVTQYTPAASALTPTTPATTPTGPAAAAAAMWLAANSRALQMLSWATSAAFGLQHVYGLDNPAQGGPGSPANTDNADKQTATRTTPTPTQPATGGWGYLNTRDVQRRVVSFRRKLMLGFELDELAAANAMISLE